MNRRYHTVLLPLAAGMALIYGCTCIASPHPAGRLYMHSGGWITAREGGGNAIVELNYQAPSTSSEAVWQLPLGMNLSTCSVMTLRLKGSPPGVHFTLAFEDHLCFKSVKDLTLPDGWTSMTIPLDDFPEVRDWYHIKELSFIFRHQDGAPNRGRVMVGDIHFAGRRDNPPPRPKRLQPERPSVAELGDEQFLDMVERAAVLYFWAEACPSNGLVKDRAMAFYEDDCPSASIAAVGFGLPCLCIAAERGWLSRNEVYRRILTTLDFFVRRAECVHGFYYHFLDMNSGRRRGRCEISSIDTALLAAGSLFAGEYFADTEVERLARLLYTRIEWDWLLDGEENPVMGWTPEHGFLKARWSSYCENLILLILGIGSPTHPLPPSCWRNFSRPLHTYGPFTYIGPPVLFVHQYPHMFIDFRRVEDGIMDYFENSRQATLANRQWVLDNRSLSRSYGRRCWGLTACDGPDGYRAYGAPGGLADGTIAPTAAGGAIVFTPELSIAALRWFYAHLGEKIWGRYGFVDAFNLDRKWYSRFHLGIDQGALALMIENHRTGLVWKHFMNNEYVLRGLRCCGFKGRTHTIGTLDLSGTWLFARGDDPRTIHPAAVRTIRVPAAWNSLDLGTYDGYAWYQRRFLMPSNICPRWENYEILLELGGIDDADQTFLNGRLIGTSGSFPPHFHTAWDQARTYPVPHDLIRCGRTNVVAVRVFDAGGDGGIWRGPVRLRAVRRDPFPSGRPQPTGSTPSRE